MPDQVLDVHKAPGAQRQGQLFAAFADDLREPVVQVVGGINGDGIPGVDPRPFDVLHDAGDQHVLPVGNDVRLQLDPRQVLVDQHRVFDPPGKDLFHVVPHLLRVPGDGHVLPADHVGGPEQHRISQRFRGPGRFLHGADGHALRAADAEPFKKRVEALPVLRDVDGFRAGAQDADPLLIQVPGQPDGGLPAEGHHHAHGLFHPDNVHHVLGGKGFKIQPVGGVVIGGNRFRIVVDDDGVIAHFPQGPDAVDGAVVEFDALPDADGPAAQDQDHRLSAAPERPGFADALRAGIEIGGLRGELGPAGVHHLIAEGPAGQVLRPAQAGYGGVRVAQALEARVVALLQPALRDAVFDIRHALQLVQEKEVDPRDRADLLRRHASLQRLEHGKNPPVVPGGEPLPEGKRGKGRRVQAVQADFRAPHGLHQGLLKALADGHDLAGGLHPGAERAGAARELVEGPFGKFDRHIVQGGLEAGAGHAGDVVHHFVQGIAQGDAGGYLGDGIAGGLARQGGGAGDPRIDLDHRVFKGIRVQGELAVAAAHDAQGLDHAEGSRTEHLVFPVRQRQRRGRHDAVPGVDAHGVHVFHGTDGHRVAGRVPHDLELDLLPAGNAFFHQDLADRGGVQAAPGDPFKLVAVFGDAPAAAAQGVGRPDDYRIADGIGGAEGLLRAFCDLGGNAGLPDGTHGVPEFFPVLGPLDGLDGGAQQPDPVFGKDPGAAQLHGEGQGGLPPEAGQQPVRAFLRDDAAKGFHIQGLQVDFVRHVPVGHDGGGVGIHQRHVHALRLEYAAGLGPGVIEFRCLADDDGAGADDQRFPDRRVLRHAFSPPSWR